MILQLLWLTKNPNAYYRYALVQIGKDLAQQLIGCRDEAINLALRGSEFNSICYKAESPEFLSSVESVQHLKDIGSGDPFIAKNGFSISVTEKPIKLPLAQVKIATEVRLHVTGAGCYWTGVAESERLHVETGFLDWSYVNRFLNGRLECIRM